MIDRSYTHNLRSCEIKSWKQNSGLNGFRTHDLRCTGIMGDYHGTEFFFQDLISKLV